jgi:DNA-binding NarL/FixJ family response regulator
LYGLRKVVEDDPRFQVVAEASTMPSFWQKVIAEGPEVGLVDWSMASQDLAATAELLQSDLHTTSMIFLTVSENSQEMQEKQEMLRLGASGFLSKRSSARKLQKAVFKAGKGQPGAWEFSDGSGARRQPLGAIRHRRRATTHQAADP